MFRLRVIEKISNEVYCALRVAVVGVGWSSHLFTEKSIVSRCSQTASFVTFDVAMYSASVVERAMHS